MEANNNFKKLMEEEEISFTAPIIVEKKIVSTISVMDFFGRTLELFIPTILQLMIVMTGGTVDQIKETEIPDLLAETGESEGDYDGEAPGDASTDLPGEK